MRPPLSNGGKDLDFTLSPTNQKVGISPGGGGRRVPLSAFVGTSRGPVLAR